MLTKNTSTEENLGVSKPKFFSWQFDQIKNCTGCGLVILSLCYKGCSQDVVSSLELRIQHLIRETGTANCDAGQHPVTLVLVHHQFRLNT